MPDRGIRGEWALLLTAVQALTRVPVSVAYAPDQLRRATRYMPLVGVGVGALAALVLVLAQAGLPPVVAALLSLAATLLLTGALHEDGLADCCDGLLGGRTRDDALRIMRDSRIGAFGALGLGVVLATQVACVAGLPRAGAALVAAHAASRFWTVVPPALLPYARPQGMAAGMAAQGGTELLIAGACGLLPLLLLGAAAAPALGLSVAVAAGFGLYVRPRLGGYTGDVLGATQQLTFTAILLAALWHAG